MRGSRLLTLTAFPSVLALALACAPPARAQSLFGYAQGQYQRFEEVLQTRDSTGAISERRRSREFWVQNYELRNLTSLRPDLQLQANVRFTDLKYTNLPDGSRTPQGTMRLNGRVFAVSASHRPTSSTAGVNRTGVSAPGDSTRLITVTSRAQETMFTGAVFPGRGPRFDLMWVRQHRNGDLLGPGSDATNRSARVGYDRGPLRLYGLLGDLRRTPEVLVRATTVQRTWSGGGNLTFSPVRATSASLQYDISDTRTNVPGQALVTGRTHAGSLISSYRPTRLASVDLNYNLRRSTYFNRIGATHTEQDGGLFLTLTPRKTLRFSTGGGTRTVDVPGGTDLITYYSTILAGDGQVRPGWFGSALASHTYNWDPERGHYATESVRLGSRLRLARGLDADLNGQVSANGDTAAHDQRWSSELSARLSATPLRSFTFAAYERVFRVGASLGRASGRATTTQGDLRWRPVPSLEMVGSLNTTSAATGGGPRATSRMGMVRWSPLRSWQLVGNYARSEQSRQSAFAEQLAGREIAGLRVTGTLGRRLTLNAGATGADLGTSRETRQYDGSVTMTLGR
jgi:hypothetical protein